MIDVKGLVERSRELLEGITPGPWDAEPMVPLADNAFYIKATPDGNNSEKDIAVVGPCLAKTTKANSRLIAAAPTIIAEQTDALEQLQAEVERLRSALEDIAADYPGEPPEAVAIYRRRRARALLQPKEQQS